MPRRASSLSTSSTDNNAAGSTSLGLGAGVGLRTVHYGDALESTDPGDLPWFEVISENFMFSEGPPLEKLERARALRPVALHGVSLSIGSHREGRKVYLDRLAALIARVDPWMVSDHFCWTGIGGHNTFDLLPLPRTEECLQTVIDNVSQVQDRLGRMIFLENASAYVAFEQDVLGEWEFNLEVLKRTGAGLLLDINNLYVNSKNFLFCPREVLRNLPSSVVVGSIHLAGHSLVDDFLFDTHDGPVADSVWDLYREALSRLGLIPTMIEWDAAIPPWQRLLEECSRVRQVMAEVRSAATHTPAALRDRGSATTRGAAWI